MRKRDIPHLVLGILITFQASCYSPSDNGDRATPETAIEETPSIPIAGAGESTPAALPPELPAELIPPGTSINAGDWRVLGSDQAGLSLRIPPDWVNMTDQINIPLMDNRLGINLVFAADSERTGRSLLAGKSFSRGAYVTGLIAGTPASAATDPEAAFLELLDRAAPAAVRLTDVTPILSANGIPGYFVDVGNGPIGLNATQPGDLRTRVAVFLLPGAPDEAPSWIAILCGASSARWEQNVASFERMLQSARVFHVRPGEIVQDGNIIVRGELDSARETISASLERGVNDLWTFTTAGSRYASIFLSPEDPQIDLALTVLGPDRQAVAHMGNGFAGETEATTDVPLVQPGEYIIEVSEFSGESGRYSLSLALSDQPRYDDGGSIAYGQVIRAALPINGRHTWVFPGLARQRLSVVVEPGDGAFDPVLELNGADGRPLLSLDEGLSGDPEIISGYELPADGEYAMVVHSLSSQEGFYTISLDEGDRSLANFLDAGDLAYGTMRIETLQRREAHAWFFTGRPGDYVLIRVTPLSASLDPDVWLLDEAVERIAAEDAFAAGEPETIELTLSREGRYIILVRDFNGEPGDYEVALGAAPVPTPEMAGSLALGDVVISTVQPGAAVVWTFPAEAGDSIDVTVDPTDLSSDIVLRLQGPDGLATLAVDESSAGDGERIDGFRVPVAGIWRLVVSEFFGETANYRLALERGQ